MSGPRPSVTVTESLTSTTSEPAGSVITTAKVPGAAVPEARANVGLSAAA